MTAVQPRVAVGRLVSPKQAAAADQLHFDNLTVVLTQTGSDGGEFGFCLGPVDNSVCQHANHLYPSDPLANAIGNFFLSLGGGQSAQYGLIVDLDAPVSQTGGFMMDIDGVEQWTVTTYSDTNGVTQTGQAVFTAGNAGTGDGLSTLWSFNHPTADIREIRFTYTGTWQHGVGVGFDLFSFGQLPLDVPSLSINQARTMSLTGSVGRSYRVDFASAFPSASWTPVTNIVLPISPFFFRDSAATNTARFYRAVGMP